LSLQRAGIINSYFAPEFARATAEADLFLFTLIRRRNFLKEKFKSASSDVKNFVTNG